jgi:transcription-repair coupling factor (superfamily II helicase)
VIVVLPDAAEPSRRADDLARFRGAPSDVLPEADAAPVSFADRLRAARRLASGAARVVVASARAPLQPLPSPATAERTRIRLATGDRVDLDDLSTRFAQSRYERTHAVEFPGEYAIRGGILDVFPYTSDEPVRVELMGSEIESVRAFAVADQGATRELKELDFSLMPLEDGAAMRPSSWTGFRAGGSPCARRPT